MSAGFTPSGGGQRSFSSADANALMSRLNPTQPAQNPKTPDFRTDPYDEYIEGVQTVRLSLQKLLEKIPDDQPDLRKLIGAMHATMKELLGNVDVAQVTQSLQPKIGIPQLPGLPSPQQGAQAGAASALAGGASGSPLGPMGGAPDASAGTPPVANSLGG